MKLTYYSPEEVQLDPHIRTYLPDWAEPGEYGLVTATDRRDGEKAFVCLLVSSAMMDDAYDPKALIESMLREALDRIWNDHEQENE